MSELMDKAVLTMPYELAMADELSRMQFWSRVQLLYKEHQAALQALRAMPQGEPVAWTVAGPVTNWSRDFSAYRAQHYVRPVFAPPHTEAVRMSEAERPSAEWYAAKIQETLDDDFTIGPPATKEQP